MTAAGLDDFHTRKAKRTEHYERWVNGWKQRPCSACAGSGRLHACVDTLMDEAERLTNERDAAMRARCANFDAVSAERDAFRAEVEREAARGGQS